MSFIYVVCFVSFSQKVWPAAACPHQTNAHRNHSRGSGEVRFLAAWTFSGEGETDGAVLLKWLRRRSRNVWQRWSKESVAACSNIACISVLVLHQHTSVVKSKRTCDLPSTWPYLLCHQPFLGLSPTLSAFSTYHLSFIMSCQFFFYGCDKNTCFCWWLIFIGVFSFYFSAMQDPEIFLFILDLHLWYFSMVIDSNSLNKLHYLGVL